MGIGEWWNIIGGEEEVEVEVRECFVELLGGICCGESVEDMHVGWEKESSRGPGENGS